MENDVSPLRLAVTCLMEAAAKMSAAGEAMSVAGQAMSAAGETISAAAKAISIITKSATPRDIERETLDQSLDKGTMEGTSHEKASVTSEECTNPEDSDYYVLENETGIQNGAVGVRPEEACEKPGVSPREETSLPTGQPQVGEIHPTTIDRSGGDFKGPFSILVDREGDVLPIVCSIIREHKRVICYMPCAPSALDMYKDLIREPSGAMVLSITEASVDYLPYFFFECESFVLLVSEGIYLEELSKHGPIPCVIHVNWPSDVVRYQKQTSSVVAQVSVLVAFLEDRDIYPSGVEIMSRTIPWPSTEKLIKSLDTLRSTFQQELDTISPDAKEEMYFHWIACHGPHGSRYVKSWDAATLAHRANLYLLDVLQYKDEPSPDDDENELQVPLPRVPLEFIVENNLEQAVEEGVLYVAAAEAETTLSAWKDSRVKESAIPLNEASGHNGIKGIMPLDKTKNAESETRAASLADSYAQTSKPSHSEERFSIPTGHNFVGSNSEPAISNTPNEPILYYPPNPSVSQQHIILEQEFDVIPLIFYLATLRPKENTLCFVQDVKMMQTLQKMVEQMVSKPVYMLALGGPKGVKKAAGQACADSEGCLIFCSRLTTLLPETVRDQTFHSVVHAGWIGDGRRYYEQRNRNNLRRATLILTRQEYDELNLTIENLRREGYETSPSTAALNDLTYNGTFAKIRTRWKDQMSDSSNYRNLCRCFEAWISYHWIGIHRVVEWSAKDVATQANIFAKKFLLHGNAKGVPRNPVHPTVGRRLAVSPAFVLDFELEDAVQDKILVVEDLGD